MAALETLAISRRDEMAIIRLNRPAKLNAMNSQMASELIEQLRLLEDARCLVIAGDERAFSSGADLTERHTTGLASPEWRGAMAALAAFPCPTVAAIEGHCLGGGLLLALHCDFRIASERASIGCPEIQRGFFPGTGMTQLVPRLIGPARAKELMMLGGSIPAQKAEAWGLLTWLVPAGEALPEACQLASRLAAGPPLALKELKRLIDLASLVPVEEALATERSALHIGSSKDAREGVRAFLERRKPTFTGR